MTIKPLETFLFRNAKPFDTGDNLAESVFPPFPSTIYGAIRTAVISQKNQYNSFIQKEDNPINKEIGSKDNLGNFAISNLYLIQKSIFQDNQLFPVPRDFVMKSKDNPNEYNKFKLYSLQKVENSNFETQSICSDLIFYKASEQKMSHIEGGWINNIEKYLKGDIENLTYTKSNQIFKIEEKIGIALDYEKGTAKDQMLFNQRRLRLKNDFALSIKINNLTSIEPEGILTLGQDRKIFSYSVQEDVNIVSDSTVDLIKEKIQQTKKFKLVFTTSVLFKEGLLPKNILPDSWIWENDDSKLQIKIRSIFSGRPIAVGGWDIQHHRPKPLRKTIPSGSVFYCELIEGNVENLFKHFYDKNICEDDQMNRQGFGHSLIGIWK